MRRFILLCLASACTSTSPVDPLVDAPTTQDDADPQLPAYEVVSKFGHDLIRSVTVHKNGGEDRTVYVEAARVAQVPTTGPLPDNTRLILEVSGGGAFVIEKIGGTWLYGTNPTTLVTQPNASCAGCHLGAAEPGVFTAPSLRRLVATHRGEEINCPQGPGPQPCAPSVYQ
jgi:hypothetical protein